MFDREKQINLLVDASLARDGQMVNTSDIEVDAPPPEESRRLNLTRNDAEHASNYTIGNVDCCGCMCATCAVCCLSALIGGIVGTVASVASTTKSSLSLLWMGYGAAGGVGCATTAICLNFYCCPTRGIANDCINEVKNEQRKQEAREIMRHVTSRMNQMR